MWKRIFCDGFVISLSTSLPLARVLERLADEPRGVEDVGGDDEVVRPLLELLRRRVLLDVEPRELHERHPGRELLAGLLKVAGADVGEGVALEPRRAAVGAATEGLEHGERGAAGAAADLEDAHVGVLVRHHLDVVGHLRVVLLRAEAVLVEVVQEVVAHEDLERGDLAAQDLRQVLAVLDEGGAVGRRTGHAGQELGLGLRGHVQPAGAGAGARPTFGHRPGAGAGLRPGTLVAELSAAAHLVTPLHVLPVELEVPGERRGLLGRALPHDALDVDQARHLELLQNAAVDLAEVADPLRAQLPDLGGLEHGDWKTDVSLRSLSMSAALPSAMDDDEAREALLMPSKTTSGLLHPSSASTTRPSRPPVAASLAHEKPGSWTPGVEGMLADTYRRPMEVGTMAADRSSSTAEQEGSAIWMTLSRVAGWMTCGYSNLCGIVARVSWISMVQAAWWSPFLMLALEHGPVVQPDGFEVAVELPRVLVPRAGLGDAPRLLGVLAGEDPVLVGEGRVGRRLVADADQAGAVELPRLLAGVELELLPDGGGVVGAGAEAGRLHRQHGLDAVLVLRHHEGLADDDVPQLVPVDRLVLVGLLAQGLDGHDHHAGGRVQDGALDLVVLHPRHLGELEDVAVAGLAVDGLERLGAEEILAGVLAEPVGSGRVRLGPVLELVVPAEGGQVDQEGTASRGGGGGGGVPVDGLNVDGVAQLEQLAGERQGRLGRILAPLEDGAVAQIRHGGRAVVLVGAVREDLVQGTVEGAVGTDLDHHVVHFGLLTSAAAATCCPPRRPRPVLGAAAHHGHHAAREVDPADHVVDPVVGPELLAGDDARAQGREHLGRARVLGHQRRDVGEAPAVLLGDGLHVRRVVGDVDLELARKVPVVLDAREELVDGVGVARERRAGRAVDAGDDGRPARGVALDVRLGLLGPEAGGQHGAVELDAADQTAAVVRDGPGVPACRGDLSARVADDGAGHHVPVAQEIDEGDLQSCADGLADESAASMLSRKTGVENSSRPMANHWAPWPVKTKARRTFLPLAERTGSATGSSRAETACLQDEAMAKDFHGSRLLRVVSVFTSLSNTSGACLSFSSEPSLEAR
ncbi:hypothetical protein ColKHC_08255 [Colletotrichum higginsianum]|nr:hypothetical protein ColKHC_08255 [Colletotrichum higginsianum]